MELIIKNNIDIKIVKIAQAVLKKKKLNFKSNSKNIPEWDFLNHMVLMISLQKKFKLKFDLYEIININSLDQFKLHIKEDNLFGFYTSKKKYKLRDLRNFFIKKFPNYMIPKKIINLKKFPLSNRGKIDYNILEKKF